MAGANKKTCSRACANKNRRGIFYKKRGEQTKDKVKYYLSLKSRLLAARGNVCERCDYDKPEILQVHHRDSNQANNELDNLELLCPNCHAEEHHFLRKKHRYLKVSNSWK